MKYMVERVREYINRKTVRARMRKAISILCCVVVFVTTYALILPSLALEKTVICGKEEHEHTADCYTRELVCGQEESEAHQHTDECYEDVLTCGKEVHVHTLDCYEAEEPEEEEPAQEPEEPEEPAVEETAQEPAAEETDEPEETAAPEETVEEEEEEEQETPAVEEPQEQEPEDDPVEEQVEEKSDSGKTEKADKADTSKEEKKKEEVAEPEKLGKIDFADLLTNDTDVFYLPENAGSDDWEAIDGNVKLDPEETVILHIAYEIPAGELNATNTETEYYLPIEIAMSDKEVEAVNKYQSTVFDGTDRKSDDLKKAGEFEIEEKTNDKGEVTERKLVIRFNDYAAGKVGGEKLTDGTITAKPEKIEGFLELSVSAADLLTLERVDDAAYKLEWNDDDRLDTTVHFDEEKLAAFENQDKEETADETAKKDEKEQSEKKQPEKKVVIQEIEEEKPAETEAPAQEQTEETAKTEEAAEEVKYASGRLTFDGGSYTVTADFDESAKLPEGVQLKAIELQGATYDMYLNKAQDAVDEGKEVTGARFFDITFVNTNGEPVEPQGMVDVKIQYKNSETIDKDANVEGLHFTEEGAENVDVDTKGIADNHVDVVTFQSDSFSVYGILYTVDFEIVNPETGKVYTYSLEGGKSINLTELLVILGIKSEDEVEKFVAEEVTDVKFSDPELVKVTHKGKFLGLFGTEDWLLESLQPFSTEETLTIMLRDGGMITVKVTDSQASGDLAAFITDATLQIDGKTYGEGENWPTRPEVDYVLKLYFEERGLLQFPKGGNEITLNMPDGLTLKPDAHGTFDIPCGLAGTVTGNTWWIDDNGVLHIKFGQDPDDLLTRSSNIHFNIGFNASFDGSETEFEFNDDVVRNVEYDNSADVNINKTGSYNSTTGKMEYTITVKSTGKPENIKVTDRMSGDMLTLDADSITISPSGKTPSSQSVTGKGFEMTFAEMAHNETLTIKYTASVDTSKLGPNGTVTGDDGKNSVKIEAKDIPEKEKENTVHTIHFSDISKSSVSQQEVAGDDNKVELTWKIIANKECKGSIVGTTITDKIDWNSKDIMKYSDNPLTLNIVVKDKNGSVVSTLTPLVPVSDNNGQQSWTYTVPGVNPGIEDSAENYTYEITYTTIAEKQKNDTNVKNDTNNGSGGSSSGSGVIPGTNPGGDEPSDKIVTSKTPTKVTTEYIDWDIVINVPEEGFPNGLTVIDNIPQYHEYTDSFEKILDITGLINDETYSVEAISTDLKEDGSIDWELRNNGKTRDVVTIEFYRDAAKTLKGVDPQARTITIKIRTRNNQEWMAAAVERGGGDPLFYHYNIAKVNDVKIQNYGIPLASTIEKTTDQSIQIIKDGVSVPLYEYVLTLSNVSELPVTITDQFDSDYLEYYDSGDPYSKHNTIAAAEQKHQLNEGVDGYTAEYTVNGNTLTITANDLPKKQDGSFYEYYRVYYRMNLKPSSIDSLKRQALLNGGTYSINNSVNWNDHTGEYDVEYKVPGLEKTGYFSSTSNNRLYTFFIDVNKEGMTMNNGEVMDLIDSHTANLSVDYSSIRVYKITDGQKQTDGRNYNLTNEMLTDEVTWNFDSNEGTFKIPDKTHYVIKYNALIIGSGYQSFSNVAEMRGFSSTKEDHREFGDEIDAGGGVYEIRLLKYEAGQTSKGLQGATFQLFKGTGEYDPVTGDEIKEEMKYGAGPRIGQNVTFTTGSDGTTTIKLNQTDDGNQLDLGVHYYLKEIDSPPGYQIDQSVEYWEFTLTTDPDEVNYGDPDRRDERGRRQWIYFYFGDILKMANTSTVNPIDVNVNKSWYDVNGNEITGENLNRDYVAKIQLMRKTDDGEFVNVKVTGSGDDLVITELSDDDTTGQVLLNYDNEWKYSWENLPRVELGGEKGMEIIHRFSYKVEEVEMDGYIIAVDETEDELTKTYSLKNYKIPEDKDTNITVKKEWRDQNGDAIAGTTEKLPDEIQYYIYQLASTTPFTRVPTTGGTMYVIEGNSHLVKPDATITNKDYGKYKATKEEGWSVLFEGLPEVRTTVNADGSSQTLYYAYYVKEIPLEGYTTTYEADGTTRTIVNREPLPEGKYIDIGLEKKWSNGTSEITPPAGARATFTVHQQKSTKQGGVPAGTIAIIVADTTVISCNPGDTILINVPNGGSGYNLVINDSYVGWKTETQVSYDIPDNYENTELRIRLADTSASIESVDIEGAVPISYTDPVDTGLNKTITLPHGSSWSYTIKNLIQEDENGNLYTYYITEDSSTPTASNVEFVDKDGNNIKDARAEDNRTTIISTSGSKVVVNNTVETKGKLKVTKNIKTNGTIDTSKTGTFYFAVYDSEYNAETTQKPVSTGSIVVTENGTNTVTVEDLPYDTYYVYELTEENGTPIISGTDGVVKAINSTVYKVTGSGTSAVVSATEAEVVLNNDIETVKAKVVKVWDDNNDSAEKRPASLNVTLYATKAASGTEENTTDEKEQQVTLNEANEWGRSLAPIADLPKYDAYGNEIQYHWVEENMPDGYILANTSSETDTTTGVVTTTLTNKLQIFDFTKIWKTAGNDIEKWPEGKTITVTLYSTTGGTNEVTVDTFTLDATGGRGATTDYTFTGVKNDDNTYTFSIIGLPARDAGGQDLTYYVKEATVEGYKAPEYGVSQRAVVGGVETTTVVSKNENADRAENDQYITNRPEDAVTLPESGGIGTTLFTILGSILSIFAAAMLYMRRQRLMTVKMAANKRINNKHTSRRGGGGLL